MVRVEVAFRAEEVTDPGPETVAVVLDVLRATTWIATALEQGAWGVRPVLQVDEALELADSLRREGHRVRLAGERDGLPPPGFDLGNSPAELTRVDVAGHRLVLTTTNGTRTLARVDGSAQALVASLRNVSATAAHLAAVDHPVLLACAGTRGRLSLEDVLAAGWLVRRLQEGYEKVALSDAARVTASFAAFWEGRELEALRVAEHGQRLLDLGFAEDLEMAARRDVWEGVVLLQDGWLRTVGLGETAWR